MWEISKSPNIVNLHREMTTLKLKINVNLPQLLCIVISAAENGEFERFGGFSVDCYVIRRRQGWKAHFRPLQRQTDFHPEIRITRLSNRPRDKLKG